MTALKRLLTMTVGIWLALGACASAPSPTPSAARATPLPSAAMSPSRPAIPTPTDLPDTPLLAMVQSAAFRNGWIGRIIHFHGQFLAYGWDCVRAERKCGSTVWASIDATHWSKPIRIAPSLGSILVPSPKLLVMADSRDVWISRDGTHFRRTHSEAVFAVGADGGPTEGPYGIAVASGAWGPKGFVLVGGIGCVDCYPKSIRAAVWRSKNGLDWHRVPNQPAFNHSGMSLVMTHGDQYVAVGNKVWISHDAMTWRRTGPPLARRGGAVGAGGTGFIVASYGARTALLATSEDGHSWTALRRMDGFGDIAAIAPGKDRYLVVGETQDQKLIEGPKLVDGARSGWRRIPRAVATIIGPSGTRQDLVLQPTLAASGATDAIIVGDLQVVVGWVLSKIDPDTCRGLFSCDTEADAGAVWVGHAPS